ncbi:Intraflagellar Transport Protein 81 [Thraustotheca clavata]|uniref:Intraflagellar Transport Protein 81 n=1 Tax=Thraustotheca clavata TaxID=74557 RepID=A0A1W0ABD9_9STRA|nr:Intraflagellar Transport Protein 81 [Thraustotheca clavata]
MSELQLIVEKLNKEPFNHNFTLVAFDEKSNFELLQILNEVFSAMDARHNIDLRDELDEQRTYRYMELLQLLKFQLPQDIEDFRENLTRGERMVVYPILYWALKNFPVHKKRAYLGRFLAPLQVPQEFLGNDTLNSQFEQYKQFQNEFKNVHKQVEQLRTSKIRPGELRKEITQLEEESHQLSEKIAHLKKKTANESGFKDILEATSALRKEQEEQAKLAERKRDQMMGLNMAQKRSRDYDQRLNEMRQSITTNMQPDQLFDQLQNQVDRHRDILINKFPAEFRIQQEKLQHLDAALSEPPKTEADIADMEDEIQSLKNSIQHFTDQLNDIQKAAGDDKLAIFRQHANIQTKKLNDKIDEMNKARQEKVALQKQLEEQEAKMAEVSGPKFMKREEFKQYANTLRNKTNHYKKMKAELAEITAESVVLHRTEQVLKSRDNDLDSLLKDIEASKGVVGYMDTEGKLNEISERNAQVNAYKGETLEEISRIVTDINQTLKERKNQLAPQIKDLRAVRQKYQEMEQVYLEKKAQYDNTAVGLETERIKLEQECTAFQDDCLREESQYHHLNALLQIETARLEKVTQEEEFEKGNGKLLRDFRTFQELYKNKVNQQESLTKELRKQQKTLKSNLGDYVIQRNMFDQLHNLLQCKLKVTNTEQGNMKQDLFSTTADIAQFEVGGANVMTIDA